MVHSGRSRYLLTSRAAPPLRAKETYPDRSIYTIRKKKNYCNQRKWHQKFKKKEETRQQQKLKESLCERGNFQVWGCESPPHSGNPWVHTMFQSKSIDLAALWQIIPVALHMTQSACWIAFWWAICLLVYQPNHLLMTASRCSLHFCKWRVKGHLEISSYGDTFCLKSAFSAGIAVRSGVRKSQKDGHGWYTAGTLMQKNIYTRHTQMTARIAEKERGKWGIYCMMVSIQVLALQPFM